MYTTHQCMIKARLNTAFSGLLLYPNPLSLSKWRTWFEGSHPRTPNRLVAETRAKPRESLTLLSLKWLAKLTKFEDKAPTQPNCNNNNNPNSTCPFSTSTLHLIPYPKLLSLGLNKIFQNHFMRIFFCLCRKRSPCVLKTVIIKKRRRKEKERKMQTTQAQYLILLTLPRSWRTQLALTSRGALPGKSHMALRRGSEPDPPTPPPPGPHCQLHKRLIAFSYKEFDSHSSHKQH